MSARILVVDDEPDIRFLLKDILEDEGYQVDVAEHARAANQQRQEHLHDLILLDIWMPELDGVTLLKEWKANGDDSCPVVMMSGHGTVETAVEATRFGAVDFVEKPLSMAKLLHTVKSALSNSDENESSDRSYDHEMPVGNSLAVQNLKQKMAELATHNHPVLLLGAQGSGRRIWASYLSGLQPAAKSLALFSGEAEIPKFGGLQCNLYVEEIALVSLKLQRQIAEVISSPSWQTQYRFICASQYSTEVLMAQDKICPELNMLWKNAIRIPGLEEHIEDIPELLEYYANRFSDLEQLPYRHFGVAAQNLLRNHPWPGDIDELKRFIHQVLENSDKEDIDLDELRELLKDANGSANSIAENTIQINIDLDQDLREARENFERQYLSYHLELCGHNMTELARRVGQERTHLYRKLKALGLDSKKQS